MRSICRRGGEGAVVCYGFWEEKGAQEEEEGLNSVMLLDQYSMGSLLWRYNYVCQEIMLCDLVGYEYICTSLRPIDVVLTLERKPPTSSNNTRSPVG
jgi:hypothetical protein